MTARLPSGPVVTVTDLRALFAGAEHPVLAGLSLQLRPGEHVRILGRSGAGRTTLARLLAGRIGPGEAEISAAAGAVLPDPLRAVILGSDPGAELSGLAPTVEEEVALGLMRRGLDRSAMHARVDEVIAQLGLEPDRKRVPSELSGGRRHLTSLASGLVLEPDLLLLDDVARGLDTVAYAALGQAITALRARRPGLAVVELDLAVRKPLAGSVADRTLVLDGGRLVPTGRDPRAELAAAGVRVPGVPVPAASAARRPEAAARHPAAALVRVEALVHDYAAPTSRRARRRRPPASVTAPSPALAGADLVVHAGEIVAVTGRNGAGKSTLLHHLVALLTPTAGRVLLGGDDVSQLRPPQVAARAQLVAQDTATLVVAATVRDEVAFTPRTLRRPEAEAETCAALELLDLMPLADEHPLDLPAARRAETALAAALASRPSVLVLDEPTVALDGPGWERFRRVLAAYRDAGGTAVLASHDAEAIALADRVVEVVGGRVVPA